MSCKSLTFAPIKNPVRTRGVLFLVSQSCGFQCTTCVLVIPLLLTRSFWHCRLVSAATGANLAIGMLAGCCNVLVTQPLDTAATRKQAAAIYDPAPPPSPASPKQAASIASSSCSDQQDASPSRPTSHAFLLSSACAISPRSCLQAEPRCGLRIKVSRNAPRRKLKSTLCVP